MMKRNWITWLVIWLTLGLGGAALGWLLAAQGWAKAGATLFLVAQTLAALWLFVGLFLWREIPWVARLSRIIVGTMATALIVMICQVMGWTGTSIAAIGAYCMAISFVLGLLLIRLLLSPGYVVLGIARTLVDEAIRMKIAVVFIVVLVLLVPVLPLALDPKELLKYRIQSFLTWSMMASGTLLGLMTIFLAVGTVTRELEQRQIFMTMTKPVGRAQYLLGKWLGIGLLNLLLVVVCGLGIYVFTMLLASQPGREAGDKESVYEEVLVARQSVAPLPLDSMDMSRLYRDRLEQMRLQDPDQFGQPGSSLTDVKPAVRQQVQQAVMTKWLSVGPMQSETYVFRGLGAARDTAEVVQLRLKPEAGGSTPDGFVYLNMRVNGRPYVDPIRNAPGVPPLSEGTFHILQIASSAIDAEGNLTIEIANPQVSNRQQPTISFNVADGMQMLYRVGGFEANLVRSMAMIWVRLLFLAMLGLTAGVFLSFPTACLLSLMVYFAAAGSGYLAESLQSYSAFPAESLTIFEKIMWFPAQLIGAIATGEILGAIKLLIRMVGQGFMLLVPSFGSYNPTPLISDGIQVTPKHLGDALLWVGVIWTGTMGLIGWGLFRRRELARVTV